MKRRSGFMRSDARPNLSATILGGLLCIAPMTSASAQVTTTFQMFPGMENLPSSGPKAWCTRPDVIKNILLGLNGSAGVRDSGERMIDFKNSTTIKFDLATKTAACHGIARVSNGQMLPGTFSLEVNAAGESIWQWMNDEPASSSSKSFQLAQMPLDQTAFVEAVTAGKGAYEKATTDFAKGATRPARATQICSVLRSQNVANWIGQLVSLTTNGEGKGVITIEIAPGVRLKTWSIALSDIGSGTLVEPGSRLFNSLGSLNISERVRLSGTFFPEKVDCVKESSLTMSGSMTDPEFIMKFTSIDAYRASKQ